VSDRTILSEEAERIERLIAAQEAAANAMNRLVQVLEDKRKRSTKHAAKQRRVVLGDPLEVTPLVQAAAARALDRIRGR
jgi:hypothetical protein